MSHLSLEAKEAIVLQALKRGSKSIESVAHANNVSVSSLYNWLYRHRKGVPIAQIPANKTMKNGLSRATQLNHLVATHDLNDVSLGKYCRKHGIYSHQLTEWREAFMTTPHTTRNQEQQSELKNLKSENKQLQRELRRKEKALAEVSALLILKKKADLIWGVDEED